MNKVELVHDVGVNLVNASASDDMVAMAAWVSHDIDDEVRLDDKKKVNGLINFLYRERHMSPFEHGLFTFRVDVPIFVAREFMRHRTCLSGDTIINIGKDGRRKTLAEHYQHFNHGVTDINGRTRVLKSVNDATIDSVDLNTLKIKKVKVLDVLYQGEKQVWNIKTSRGFEIKATGDHQFYTESGWEKVQNFKENKTEILVRQKVNDGSAKRATPWSLRIAINEWTMQQKQVLQLNNGLCQECNANPSKHIDHKISVALDLSQALNINNLQGLCDECNRNKTISEQVLANRKVSYLNFSPDVVVSIEPAGTEKVYDVSVDDSEHNFIANGMIAHNCSYNEVSGRYTEMKPRFYCGTQARVQKGKPGRYYFEDGTNEQTALYIARKRHSVQVVWDNYQKNLLDGIAKEQAREDLPLSLMTQFYVTMNPRNLMQFLVLRNDAPALKEIRDVAVKMEEIFENQMPMTYGAYRKTRDLSVPPPSSEKPVEYNINVNYNDESIQFAHEISERIIGNENWR